MEPFIGQVMLFAGTFAPQGWARCEGQIMSIAQNSALYSILGTTYGGNGTTTFALPDLRGRVPLGQGTGPGLSSYSTGETGGAETCTLIYNQIPAHVHEVAVGPASGDAGVANVAGTASAVGGTSRTNPSGGNQPHENRQPYIAMNYIIAIQGIYPSRS